MDWRRAILWSRAGKAYRYPSMADVDDPGRPQFIFCRTIGKTREYFCRNFDHHSIPISEAARYHDWQPTDPTDAITALGNIDRDLPVESQPEDASRGPLDVFLEENP